MLSSRTSYTSLISSASTASWQDNQSGSIYDPSRIEVRLTPNKGFALYAASTIPQGHIVLAEIPLIRLTTEDESKELQAEEILLERFNYLSESKRKAFKKLHDTRKDGFSRLRSIYHSNCYNLDGPRSVHGGSCIGLKASRINHACVPNVQFSFQEVVPEGLLDECETKDNDVSDNGRRAVSSGVMIFLALKKITRGREIVSNYESIYATRKQRQFQLQIHYGFRCDCEVCVANEEYGVKDDMKRLEMMRLRRKVNSVEKRIIAVKKILPDDSEAKSYYLKPKNAKVDMVETAEESLPLLSETCHEMLEVLNELAALLEKAKLLGIEREKVRQDQAIWTQRAMHVCNTERHR